MRLAMSASLVLAVGLAGQDSLASDQYLTQARNAEALLDWYRNRPDRCAILPDST